MSSADLQMPAGALERHIVGVWCVRRLMQVALVLVLIAAATAALVTAPAEPAAAGPGCGSIPVLSTVCDEITDPAEWLLDQPGEIAGSLVSQAFDVLVAWLAAGAVAILGMLWNVVEGTTRPDLNAISAVTATIRPLGLGVMAPLLLLTAILAVLRQELGMLLRAVVVYLPLSAIGMFGAVTLVEYLLAWTDYASEQISGGSTSEIGEWLGDIRLGMSPGVDAGLGFTAPSLLAIGSLLVILGALVVWITLIIRQATILLATAFLPLAFAALVFPQTRPILRRTAETIVAFILSKLLIVGAFAIGAQVLNGPSGLDGMIAGAGLMLLAGFSPWALIKIIPLATSEAVSAVEGRERAPLRTAVVAGGTALAVSRLGSFGAAGAAGANGAAGPSGNPAGQSAGNASGPRVSPAPPPPPAPRPQQPQQPQQGSGQGA